MSLQLSTQLSRSNWGFRWSPDSQLVAFCEGIGSPGSSHGSLGRTRARHHAEGGVDARTDRNSTLAGSARCAPSGAAPP